jgi:serine/threonine protein kinase
VAEGSQGDGLSDPAAGTLLGSCVLEKRLGDGGMGAVFRAHDRYLKRPVAVKVLKPELSSDPDFRKRFEKEGASAAGIEHQNVVRIYSIDADADGQLYLVMEYVDGPDLSKLTKDGPLEHERALRIFDEVAAALQEVHEQGLIHRDVKPANILIRNPGRQDEQAVLTDFGIVKVVDSQTALTLGRIGTPEYMSPEVADMQVATDRSDQYALALILYRMLSGSSLYEGLEMPKAHRDEPLPDLSDLLATANRALRAALQRALSKDPAARFPSVAAFAGAVRESQAGAPADRNPLQELMEEALSESGPLTAVDLATAVGDRLAAGDAGVTPLQIEGRARLYSHLFHRLPDGRIGLRD